jgi:hypothetical protein
VVPLCSDRRAADHHAGDALRVSVAVPTGGPRADTVDARASGSVHGSIGRQKSLDPSQTGHFQVWYGQVTLGRPVSCLANPREFLPNPAVFPPVAAKGHVAFQMSWTTGFLLEALGTCMLVFLILAITDKNQVGRRARLWPVSPSVKQPRRTESHQEIACVPP